MASIRKRSMTEPITIDFSGGNVDVDAICIKNKKLLQKSGSGNLYPLHHLAKNASFQNFRVGVCCFPGAMTKVGRSDEDAGTPAHFVVTSNTEVEAKINFTIKYFPESLEIINCKDELVGHVAAAKSTLVVLKSILEVVPEEDTYTLRKGTIAHSAACRHDHEGKKIMQHIIQNYPDTLTTLDISDSLPLHICALDGTLDMFMIMMTTNPGALNWVAGELGTVAHLACWNYSSEDYSILNYICQFHPECLAIPDINGRLVLHRLLSRRDTEKYTMESMLAVYTAYPNAIRIKDNTELLPLHSLIQDGYDERERPNETLLLPSLRFLLKEYPDAVVNMLPPDGFKYEHLPESAIRIILRVNPNLDMKKYHRLNWRHRRVAVWLARGRLSHPEQNHADLAHIYLRKLRQLGDDMLREIISFV